MRSMACCIFMAGCCDFVPDGQEFGLDVLEPFHDFEVEFGLGLVVLELLLGPAEGHSFFLDEVEDEVEVVDVLAGEQSVSFFVFVGFDDVKLFFPEADEGGVDAEHFRHFADRVVEFIHWSGCLVHALAGVVGGLDEGGVLVGGEVVEVEVDGVEGFVAFSASEDEEGYRFRERTRLSDAEARRLAARILDETALTDLKAMERGRRNALLFELKDAGLSISQIQRLTGIGRNVIARAK